LETLSQLIKEAAAALDRAGIDSPRLSARLIMALVLDCSQEKILSYPDFVLSRKQAGLFRKLVARRLMGEPLAYITGHKEFFGYDFMVDESVLIPRPETEILVELAIDVFKSRGSPLFFDIGTGSGSIAVTLALEMPSSSGLACDVSLPAVRVARGNARSHHVQKRICFFLSDLGMAVKPGTIDFIASNPPYLSREEFNQASIEVSGFEPFEALVSPGKGLLYFRRLESIARHLLKEKGMIFLEMGKDQGVQVANIFQNWKDVVIHKDLAGHDRVLSCVR
jgi:release factor glutamine methyltransferase